ncbi:MAG: YscO family type III secretion system apparatus protein [Planctomycetota bacterium]
MNSDKYPLKDLLRVRQFREDSAAAEMIKWRMDVEVAKEALKERKQELADYHKRLPALEQQAYDAVFDQEIRLKELDELKLKVKLLRDKGIVFQDRVREASQNVVTAETGLQRAQAEHRSAAKDREKVDEHKEIWLQEVRRENEVHLEKEMEDFRVRKGDFDAV